MHHLFEQHIYQALVLSALPKVGNTRLRKIINDLPEWHTTPVPEIAESVKTVRDALAQNPKALETAQAFADAQLEKAHALGVTLHFFQSESYPALLRNSLDAPVLLYALGQLENTKPSVAVVGSRNATDTSLAITQEITKFLADKGTSVVSGLALGCDAMAHQTAIEEGAHTVAVLAHGLQTVAPASHRDLAQRILASGGALVSPFPLGVGAKSYQFVERDKVQAGLSLGVVLIQSALDGGSLHACRAALRNGRWLAHVVPDSKSAAENETAFGTNLCLAGEDQKAKTHLLECPPEALSHLHPLASHTWADTLGAIVSTQNPRL